MKVIKLKDLAVKLQFKPAKNFISTELYLEYIIDELNSKTTPPDIGSFHQFLFLIDVLYVVLDTTTHRVSKPLTPVSEINSHYDAHDDYIKKDRQTTKASWNPEEVNKSATPAGLFSHKLNWK